MRKLIALAALCGTALVLGVSPASTAKIDDTNGGPVCADIIDGGIVDYSNGTVTFALRTAAPSCRGILYTVNVYTDNTGATHTLLGSSSTYGTKQAAPEGDGTGILLVTVPLSSLADPNANSFCISATSSGDRVFDTAPDVGYAQCISFNTPQSGSSGGQSGFH